MPISQLPKGLSNVHICTEIIMDVQNKVSLIGMYLAGIRVNAYPAKFRLAIYAEYLPSDDKDHQVNFRLQVGSKSTVEIKGAISGAKKDLIVPIMLNVFEIEVSEDSALRLDTSVDNGKWVRAITTSIEVGDIKQLFVLAPPTGASP